MNKSKEVDGLPKNSKYSLIPMGLSKLGSLCTRVKNYLTASLGGLRRFKRPSSNFQQLKDSLRGINPPEDPYDVEIGWTQGSPISYSPLRLYSDKLSDDRGTTLEGKVARLTRHKNEIKQSKG